MSRYTKEERKEDIPSYYIFIYGNITCTTTLKLKQSFFSQDQDSSEILMMMISVRTNLYDDKQREYGCCKYLIYGDRFSDQGTGRHMEGRGGGSLLNKRIMV